MGLPATADIGYVFYPSANEHTPGCSRLDVYIREHPTERHFDPESVQATVRSDDGRVDVMTVSHPWSHFLEYRMCAGHVTVADRKGKEVEAFTFGGKLLVESRDAVTCCVLVSDAPLLHLVDSFSVEGMLAAETEVLLAERRAAWLSHPDSYDQRLASIDSLDLYAVCLTTLEEKFAQFHASDDEQRLRFLHFLRTEQQRLSDEGLWPPRAPKAEEVL